RRGVGLSQCLGRQFTSLRAAARLRYYSVRRPARRENDRERADPKNSRGRLRGRRRAGELADRRANHGAADLDQYGLQSTQRRTAYHRSSGRAADMIAALAGGVGAAKFLQGLVQIIDPADLTVIGNTGDDLTLWGLHISPDIDIVLYTLAGIVDPEKGWGIAGDTFHALTMMRRYGGP